MKVLKSTRISPFGGLNFVIEQLDQLGIGDLLKKELPELSPQCKYSWKDLLYSFWGIFFCGGDCIEDLGNHLKVAFEKNPMVKLPSPDRVLDRMKELAIPQSAFTAPRGTSKHFFSINTDINRLNLKILKLLSQPELEKAVVLDYDNTLIYNKKSDSLMTYKKQFGYAPGVGIIGHNIVYVENRNGNSAAANLQDETLERMFSLLKEENIKVDCFRADAASYRRLTLKTIVENSNKFYIRAVMGDTLDQAIKQIENWEGVEFENEIAYRGSTMFTPFEKITKRIKSSEKFKAYRLVVTKVKRSDGQINMYTGEACNYSAILTNDMEKTNDEIVGFYNQRGAAEKEFDILKNDFGWDNMPFSKLEFNTVFLIFSAICRNIYNKIIQIFSLRVEGLLPKFRIKRFIFRFICTPAKWVKPGRTYKLRLYGEIAFKT